MLNGRTKQVNEPNHPGSCVGPGGRYSFSPWAGEPKTGDLKESKTPEYNGQKEGDYHNGEGYGGREGGRGYGGLKWAKSVAPTDSCKTLPRFSSWRGEIHQGRV